MSSYFQNSQPLKDHLAYLALDFDAEILEFQFSREKQSRVVLICTNQTGQKFILKILLKDDQKYLERFEREIALLKYLQNGPVKTNKIINSGGIPSLWILLDFLPGEDTGTTFSFSAEVVNEKFVDQLIALLKNLKSLEPFPPSINMQSSTKELSNDLLTCIDDLHPLARHKNRLQGIFQQNQNYFNDKGNYCFVHGDLLPKNIVLNDQCNISLIDWELCDYKIKTFDAAYLYQRLLIFKEEREYFEKRLFEEILDEKDKENFRFWNLLLIAKDLDTFRKMREEGLVLKHNHAEAIVYANEQHENYQDIFSKLINQY